MKTPNILYYSHKFSDNWAQSQNLIKFLFNRQGSNDIYQSISQVEAVKKIFLYEVCCIENNNHQNNATEQSFSNTRFTLYHKPICDYNNGRKNLKTRSRKVKVQPIKAGHPFYKAFFNVITFNSENFFHFVHHDVNKKKFIYFLVIGTTCVKIYFDDDNSNKTQVDFLIEVFFQVITRNAIDDKNTIQASISNLPIIYEVNVLGEKKNNSVKKNNSILQILEGNTMLLNILFGFTLIVYELSDNANMLCEGNKGFVYDFRHCGFQPVKMQYLQHNDVYDILGNDFFNEVLKLPIYSQSEVTIKVYAPNYSQYMARSILRLKTFINNIRIAFETFLKYKLDSDVWLSVQKNLRKDSETDYLTKLFNRNGFFRVASEINYSSEYSLTIIEIDIDNFKQINDTYGHGIGDLVLQKNASIMRYEFNRNCLLSRFGGEEFYILVINQNKIDAIRMLEAYRGKLSENAPLPQTSANEKPLEVFFTVSCGVSFLEGTEIINHKLLSKQLDLHMDKADKALYKAKRSGKDCIYLYEGDNLLAEEEWLTLWTKRNIK